MDLSRESTGGGNNKLTTGWSFRFNSHQRLWPVVVLLDVEVKRIRLADVA